MTTSIIELDNSVFEITMKPGDEVPGRCKRVTTLRQLSGPPLTPEQWQRAQESIVRELINIGCRVYRAGTIEGTT